MVILPRLKRLAVTSVKRPHARLRQWTTPLISSLPLGTIADLGRSKSELIAENALLRQQLIILKRQVKRSAQEDQVLAKERIFCNQFGFVPGKVNWHPRNERGGFGFGPEDKVVEERAKTHGELARGKSHDEKCSQPNSDRRIPQVASTGVRVS